jgi:oligosaccharide repeat unit polymerase
MVFQDFVPCPVPINVATAMSPYFKDFGYVGVLIFGIIVGFVTGATYKLAQSGQNIMKMLYAYFLITLALQFFDELLFVGLSSLFQIIAVLIFCFVKISFREDSSSNSAV